MVPVKVPVPLSELQALTFVVELQERHFSGMPSKTFVGMEVTSNGDFGDLKTPKCYLPL